MHDPNDNLVILRRIPRRLSLSSFEQPLDGAVLIVRVSYVVNFRHRPGENGWDKQYELEDVEGEEEDVEWLEALEEANGYMGVGYVETRRSGR